MSRVRVRCVAPPSPPRVVGTYPMINGLLASIVDCEIALIDNEGKEHPIPGVTRMYWSVASDNAPTELVIHVDGGELVAELEAHGVQVIIEEKETEHGREEETGRVHDGSDDVRSEHGDAQRSPARDGNS